jgi:acyl-CoA synthetase (AMP-forming)/AMP-acid ligase II
MYGLTEAFRSTYLDPAKFATKAGSIGRAIPNAEVFVVAPGQGECGPGERGELVHRGSLISQGYWNNPQATAEKFRSCPELAALLGDEKVVYSGDIVYADDDGDLWFVGRADRLMKCSGFRLSPDEVEDLVYRSGLVAEAVAFGVADDLWGQVVHLAVSPFATSQFDVASLAEYCQRTMPHYMVPRKIHVHSGPMPRTSSGKLDTGAIIAMFTQN